MKRKKLHPKIGQLVRLKQDYKFPSLPLWSVFSYSYKMDQLSSKMSLDSFGLIVGIQESMLDLVMGNTPSHEGINEKESNDRKLGIQLLSSEGGIGWNYAFYFETVE